MIAVTVASQRGNRTWELSCAVPVFAVAVLLLVVTGASPTAACVGSECMQIWSTEPGGGALAVEWDFEQTIPVYQFLCTSTCLYSASDPGFIAPALGANGYSPLADGTTVRIEIESIDAGLVLQVQGTRLTAPGEAATIGTMPEVHAHPTWRVSAEGGVFGEYRVTYRLTTDSPLYGDSESYTAVVVNVPPEQGSPTPTPTPTPLPCRDDCGPDGCAGDCDEDGRVSLGEVVHAVEMALGQADMATCAAANTDGDGAVSVVELVAVVDAALQSCPPPREVAFSEVQAIFTASCATATCHDTQSATGNLILTEGFAYDGLVGVEPDTFAAQALGFLRVDPSRPENSFLLVKLLGPPPGQGGRMPLVGDPLDAEQVELIRAWIAAGAME